MKTISAKVAKNRFGQLIDSAQKEPIEIQKNGRSVAVVISLEEFRRFETLEDSWWASEAAKAALEGFVGTNQSEALLVDLLNAKD